MMENLLKQRFIGDVSVHWLWESDPMNYKQKVDGIVNIMVANSEDKIALQVKGTDYNWTQNITVGKSTMDK